MLDRGRSQQSIDHGHSDTFPAQSTCELPPAIDNTLVDVQYPVGEPQQQIATEPYLKPGTASALGQGNDAFPDLSQREDAQE